MNRLGIMLVLSMNIINTMGSEKSLARSAYNSRIRRAISDSSSLPQRCQLTQSSRSLVASDESSDTEYEDASDIDSDEHDNELNELARLTTDPSADPLATLRGKIKVPKRPQTHEATYDDIARLIQFNSKAALGEARALNRNYIDATFAQLQQEATAMRAQVSDGVSSVSTSLVNLDGRLQQVEKLLPRVKKLLEQEKILSGKYEETCTQLSTAFETYEKAVTEKEITIIELLQALTQSHRAMKEKLDTLDVRTRAMNYTGEETRSTVRLQLWKDKFMSACAIITSLGVLTFIISQFMSGNQETGTIETNASLHPTV